MNFYEDPKKDHPDTYYEDKSREAIDEAIKAAKGKTLEEIRFAIRRSYCFGALRKGKAYKIWNKLVHEKERELGLAPRKHKS